MAAYRLLHSPAFSSTTIAHRRTNSAMGHLLKVFPFHGWNGLSMQRISQKYIVEIIFGVLVVSASFIFPTITLLSKAYTGSANFFCWFPAWKIQWWRPFDRDQPFENGMAEQRYWHFARLYGARLQSSNARSRNGTTLGERASMIPYYSPSLLPMYRTKHATDLDVTEYYLPARIFCKWHYMVHPGPVGIFDQT